MQGFCLPSTQNSSHEKPRLFAPCLPLFFRCRCWLKEPCSLTRCFFWNLRRPTPFCWVRCRQARFGKLNMWAGFQLPAIAISRLTVKILPLGSAACRLAIPLNGFKTRGWFFRPFGCPPAPQLLLLIAATALCARIGHVQTPTAI